MQAEETEAVLADAWGRWSPFVKAGWETAGISGAGMAECRGREACSAYGEKEEEQDGKGKGPDREDAHGGNVLWPGRPVKGWPIPGFSG